MVSAAAHGSGCLEHGVREGSGGRPSGKAPCLHRCNRCFYSKHVFILFSPLKERCMFSFLSKPCWPTSADGKDSDPRSHLAPAWGRPGELTEHRDGGKESLPEGCTSNRQS